jgi:hypothetical protein
VLEYRYANLKLGKKHFILLPKLNDRQIKILETKLITRGFKVENEDLIIARKKGVRVYFSRIGFCWSSTDPTDYVAPLIPEILECKKENVKKNFYHDLYFKIFRMKSGYSIRFKTRLERGYTWKLLRRSNISGFSPDECSVIKSVLYFASGTVRVLTSFPNDISETIRIGTKYYFISDMDVREFTRYLEDFSSSSRKKAFLLQNCVLYLEYIDLKSVFNSSFEVGQWCYFYF